MGRLETMGNVLRNLFTILFYNSNDLSEFDVNNSLKLNVRHNQAVPQRANAIDVGIRRTDLGNSVLMDRPVQVTVMNVDEIQQIFAMKRKLENATQKFRVENIFSIFSHR